MNHHFIFLGVPLCALCVLCGSYFFNHKVHKVIVTKATKGFLYSIFFIVLSSCNSELNEKITIQNLRCEMLSNPEGIDAIHPKLSWIIESEQQNIKQTAYHILAASSPEILEKNEGDIWDSKKVQSNRSVHVTYNGIRLKSQMRCYWKVKIWTRNGESEWSEPEHWSMGLLNYKDWKGRWIGFDRAFEWDKVDKFSRLSARYFRKEFDIPGEKEINHATVYIIGLGLYELYINGSKVGNQVLSPSPTDYSKNVKYNTFDVTGLLKSGKNAIGTILGNGRYFTMRQNYKPYKIKNFGYPKMLLNLVLEYTDGSTEVIKTDDSWKGTTNGPILCNNEYDGEEYDARKEMQGWNDIQFDDSQWIQAEYVQEPEGTFEAQMNENMKVMKVIHPVSVTKLSGNRYIVDMGQNMAGWLRLKHIKGMKGDKITLRFAESLLDNGELNLAPLRDAKVTDIYILKGSNEEENWEPTFVYHGFRYAEISGFPGLPDTSNFEGCVVYDNIQTTGTFETSDTLINRIFKNAYWSIISNYKGMPIDCPQRNERMPWLGDRAAGCYGESFVTDNSRLYLKWLDDIKNSQKADGSISDVAPAYYRYYSDNMTWPGTYLFVAEMLHKQYGLIEPLEKHYPFMKKWLEYMENKYIENFILTKDSYGDWCEPPKTIEEGRGKSADVKRPSQLISTAYFYKTLQMMENFAEITGNNKDISHYKKLAEEVKIAFNKKFYHADSACYGNKSLTENLLPVAFGMVPEKELPEVLSYIRKKITIENNGHLSVGLVGAQWLMRTLSHNGMNDIANKLATSTTYPSWGYMVNNNATTIWELWNANTAAPNMNSQNHVMMLGDLMIWMYEDLAGIKSSAKATGFEKILMEPYFPEELSHVNASYQSVYGKIVSNWTRFNHTMEWSVTIPANTTARLSFPVKSRRDILLNDCQVKSSDGIQITKTSENKIALEIGSGTYRFTIKL